MLQQTIEEQERYERWHRRTTRAMTPRRLLQESDELLFWVEECLVQKIRIVPGWLIPRLMTVLRHAHPQLPSRLGRERRPEHVMEIIYDAQAALMEQACISRGPAQVIPLFARSRERMLKEAATQ
ncbi:MAG: hypothetical protein E6H95_08560 [Chloroflexi bacterium]|nr:MAG: hypothetical protein E6I41_08545 [Chloroflexota bacterium]TMF18896.1 MAG: hypothetical protein E6I35_04920 [Chloroflexota bacterium]TMF29539.1 MAG: hypothetical protein E6I29_08250 [Chloroflexota bacterium]TMG27377.1 MAG: hypothetical protein E6H95_08560 [Chloroflexota bacterium]